jgi:hypothetical protein
MGPRRQSKYGRRGLLSKFYTQRPRGLHRGYQYRLHRVKLKNRAD